MPAAIYRPSAANIGVRASAPTVLTLVAPAVVTAGLPFFIEGVLTTEDNAPVAGATIGFSKGFNSLGSAVTDANGAYSKSITLIAGISNLGAKFAGDAVYGGSMAYATVEAVQPTDTVMTLTGPTDVAAGGTGEYSALLTTTPFPQPLPDREIFIGVTYKEELIFSTTATTGAQGGAKFEYTFADKGTYRIDVAFDGDTDAAASAGVMSVQADDGTNPPPQNTAAIVVGGGILASAVGYLLLRKKHPK